MAETTAVRVLCVDDNEGVGAALRTKMQNDDRFVWLGQLTSAKQLREHVADMHPDVIVLDVDMPGSDPFAELQRLTKEDRMVQVVMLTAHVKLRLIDTAMNAGASGYISKSESPDVIVSAIERVAHGEVVFSPLVEALVEESL